MKLDHLFKELCLCARNILNRLPGHRIRREPDKVTRVACIQRDSNLTVRFEATNSRTVAGAWIHYDKRALSQVDLHASRRDNPDQTVVDGAVQRSSIDDELDLIVKNMRHFPCGLLEVGVAPLPHHVAVEDAPLCRINHVFSHGTEYSQQWIAGNGCVTIVGWHRYLAK